MANGGDQGSIRLPYNANDQSFLSENRGVDLRTQLWHEYVGLTVKVPCVGDKVFYFPHGHLEQVRAYMKEEDIADIPSYGLPSRIVCKVVHVDLKADVDTDEVFAEITLLPDDARVSEELSGSTFRSVPQKIPASSFRKRLTPSNVSIHGGCCLKKRQADQTFPPLDMSQNRTSQELVAKDLHGAIWHFRHAYSGNPKRHLLTSWCKFVRAKRLLAGDTCIFLKGSSSAPFGQCELYVGVVQAVRPQKSSTDVSCQCMQHGILATALAAVNSRTEFTVYYYPSLSPSGFIVSYEDVMESLKVKFSPEMRFEMLFDGGEEPHRNLKKFSGNIIGKEDIDPIRWPHSEWRCLKVRWDATTYRHVLPERVSPWSIQSLGSTVQHQQSLGRK